MNAAILIWLGVALYGPIRFVMDGVRDAVAFVRGRPLVRDDAPWARGYGLAMAGATSAVLVYASATIIWRAVG